MTSSTPTVSRSQSEHAWLKRLLPYRTPSRWRSVIELAVTVVPLVALWAVSWVALAYGQWWGLVLTIPAAGFLVRLFMIQHDCGHGAFFGKRNVDDWIGRVIGVLTLTPYDCWRRSHAIHHASAGNLDARGIGDVTTLTVAADKFHATGKGAETKAKLAEPIEIGLFTARPGLGTFAAKDVVVLGREPIRNGVQRVTLRSKVKPGFAGIDPYNYYVDRNSDDNVKEVTAG